MLPPPGFQTSTLASQTYDVTSTIISAAATATGEFLQIATISPSADLGFGFGVDPIAAMRPPQHNPDEGSGECKLLGPFAILIQGALGALALLSLVFKRWRERPQRPVKIWAFDVSKQVVGSILLHLANLFMSMFSAGQISTTIESIIIETKYKPNPCSFYLLNLAIDTTLGIPILLILLRLFHAGFRLTPLANPPESIQSGNYGDPPRYTWWMKQSLIYFCGLLSMKVIVLFLFQLMPWLGRVGDWALRWTEGNEGLQIAFVMLIFPLIMNAMQYYIIDIFIKGKQSGDNSKKDDEARGAGDAGSIDSSDERGGLLAGHDEHDDPTEDPETVDKERKGASISTQRVGSPDSSSSKPQKGNGGSSVEEYNPERDGEHQQKPTDNYQRHEEDEDLLERVPKPTE